jgi:hypothetical protein
LRLHLQLRARLNGRRPPLALADLIRPMTTLLAVMALAATLAGSTGFALARWGDPSLEEPLRSLITESQHNRFIAAWWAHGASYASGILGAGTLIVVMWLKRRRSVA